MYKGQVFSSQKVSTLKHHMTSTTCWKWLKGIQYEDMLEVKRVIYRNHEKHGA